MTSEITLAEVLVKPFTDERSSNLPPEGISVDPLRRGALAPATLSALYADILTHGPGLSVVPIDRDLLISAARLRADAADKRELRLPDAIHLATAERSGCEIVLSGDKRLRPTVSYSFRRVDATAQELNGLIAELT